MGDTQFIQLLKGKSESPLEMALEDENILEAIIDEGKNSDVDCIIQVLQKQLQTRIPMVPFSRTGGANGLSMTRAAYAVMIKFSDLQDEFTQLVDTVGMNSSIMEEGPEKEKAILEMIKDSPHGDVIISRWESASRIRPWINEKKQQLSHRLEKQVNSELVNKKKEERQKQKEAEDKAKEDQDKAKEEQDSQKEGKEDAKTEDAETSATVKEGDKTEPKKEPDQIDSTQKKDSKETMEGEKSEKKTKGKKGKKAEKEEKEEKEEKKEEDEEDGEEEIKLSEEEKSYVSDEAFKRLEKALGEIFEKIKIKAHFLIKLSVPLKFKKKDPQLETRPSLRFIDFSR